MANLIHLNREFIGEKKTMIPNIVHHVWMQGFSDSPVSQEGLRSMSWGAVDHMFWDEASLISLVRDHYPEWLKFFQRLPTLIVRCDVARAFILHRYGGVYADIDIVPSRTHGEVFLKLQGERRIVVASQSLNVLGLRYANNNWIACSPQNPWWTHSFLPHVKQHLKEGGAIHDAIATVFFPVYSVFATAGPIVYARAGNARVRILRKTEAESIFYHKSFNSSWIQYKSVVKHLLAVLICITVPVLLLKLVR